MNQFKILIFLFVLSVIFVCFVFGVKTDTKLKLSNIFSDNMVIQRNVEIVLYGYGSAGKVVTVEFIDEKVSVKVDDSGKWKMKLKPRDAGQFTI